MLIILIVFGVITLLVEARRWRRRRANRAAWLHYQQGVARMIARHEDTPPWPPEW